MTRSVVSEPITGWGRPSLGDDLRLRLVYFGATRIDERWVCRFVSEPIWRLYRNSADGATVHCDGRRYELRAGRVWLLPPWLTCRTACSGTVGHVNAHFEVPQWSRELVRATFPAPIDCSAAVDGDALHA
nr:hypothetical protein [Planctomycetota bacterium]